MIIGLWLFVFFVASKVNCSENDEHACLICQYKQCRCEKLGCGVDEKMSLKKLILHFLKNNRCADEDTYKPLVRVLKDILRRSSCHNINEEASIRDMIETRLKVLRGKCSCLEEPHETLLKQFLQLLLKKCLECECGKPECDCLWKIPTCEPRDGIYWFKTTEDSLRKEACKICKPERGEKRGKLDNNYKCPKFIKDGDVCGELSLCTDCESCRILVLKHKDDIWLFCDGCKILDSPYVQFTEGGCPIKVTRSGVKKPIKIKTKYLQLNDFREKKSESDRTVFECPSVSGLSHKKVRRRRANV